MTPLSKGSLANDSLVQTLRDTVQGTVQTDVGLAGKTTLKVGGQARVMVRAESVEDLQAVGQLCTEHGLEWLVIGRGSNLLVADGGWDGVAITLGKGLRGVEVQKAQVTGQRVDGDPDITRVRLGSAEPMPVLANKLESLGLGGMAFAVAIPGSLGGAVRMNAGAHGGQMADVLVSAEAVMLSTGEVRRFTAAELDMTYRQTSLPSDAVVIAALVGLHKTDLQTLAADMAQMRQWRRDHQPINQPSCGSVFRNPDGDSAGRLIDAAGLKGYRVGGAQVSPKHANFITVDADATAADVHAVLTHTQREVQRIHGLVLHPEVVIVGDFVQGA